MRAIHERGVYHRVPYPIATRADSLWATFQGATFALFPFLPGHNPPESAWPDPLWDEFARTVATIHNGTSSLTDILPPRETFDIPFADDLQSSLQAIARIGPQDRPGLRALREMILPRQDEILALLERLRKLQAIARALPGPFVLCHTDMTGDNLLVDEQGQLYPTKSQLLPRSQLEALGEQQEPSRIHAGEVSGSGLALGTNRLPCLAGSF